LISFIYALSDEFHQSFVIGRTSSGFDVAADVLGGLMGAVLFPRLLIRKQENVNKEN
jgi:VanZ family protein